MPFQIVGLTDTFDISEQFDRRDMNSVELAPLRAMLHHPGPPLLGIAGQWAWPGIPPSWAPNVFLEGLRGIPPDGRCDVASHCGHNKENVFIAYLCVYRMHWCLSSSS